jgi:hypothetical protein
MIAGGCFTDKEGYKEVERIGEPQWRVQRGVGGGEWESRSSCGGRSCREEFEVEAKVGRARGCQADSRVWTAVVFVLADCAPPRRRPERAAAAAAAAVAVPEPG